MSRQVRIAAVHPEHERDRRDEQRDARERRRSPSHLTIGQPARRGLRRRLAACRLLTASGLRLAGRSVHILIVEPHRGCPDRASEATVDTGQHACPRLSRWLRPHCHIAACLAATRRQLPRARSTMPTTPRILSANQRARRRAGGPRRDRPARRYAPAGGPRAGDIASADRDATGCKLSVKPNIGTRDRRVAGGDRGRREAVVLVAEQRSRSACVTSTSSIETVASGSVA